MAKRTGDFRNKVQILRPAQSPVRGAAGSTTPTYEAWKPWWCSIETIAGSESVSADAIVGDSTHILEGRFVPGLTTRMVIDHERARVDETRGDTQVGAHGAGFTALRANIAGLEINRLIVKSTQITSVEEGIAEESIRQFNEASNGPIDLVYTLRWPDAVDSGYDDPPATGDLVNYVPIRAAIVTALSQPQAQILILRDGLTIQFFNEIMDGPGRYNIDSGYLGYTTAGAADTESEARQVRALALASNLKAYIIANVPNAARIKWMGAGFTHSKAASPTYTPANATQTRRQTWFQQWIDKNAAEGMADDVHLLTGDDDDAAGPLVDATGRIEGPRDYRTFKGYSQDWACNELLPRYSDSSDMVGFEAFERSLWQRAFSYEPRHICRAAFYETPAAGQDFVDYSILESDAQTPKQPMASILLSMLELPTGDGTTTTRYEIVTINHVDHRRFIIQLGCKVAEQGQGKEVVT